jgi:hypothetical protein
MVRGERRSEATPHPKVSLNPASRSCDAASQVTYRCALGHCVARAYLRPRSLRPGGTHAGTGAGFIGCTLGRRPGRAYRFMEGLKMAKKKLKKSKKLKKTMTLAGKASLSDF